MDQVSWTSELTARALARTSGRNMGSIVPIHGNANYLRQFMQASTQTWVVPFYHLLWTGGPEPQTLPFCWLSKSEKRPGFSHNQKAWNEPVCSHWSGLVLEVFMEPCTSVFVLFRVRAFCMKRAHQGSRDKLCTSHKGNWSLTERWGIQI